MPYKADEPRRHKIPKARYRVQNWPEYHKALQRRGGITVWVTLDAIAAWQPPRPRARQDAGAGPGEGVGARGD